MHIFVPVAFQYLSDGSCQVHLSSLSIFEIVLRIGPLERVTRIGFFGLVVNCGEKEQMELNSELRIATT